MGIIEDRLAELRAEREKTHPTEDHDWRPTRAFGFGSSGYECRKCGGWMSAMKNPELYREGCPGRREETIAEEHRFPKDRGAVFVSRAEADRWAEDAELRVAIQFLIEKTGERLFPVTTVGGFLVDVWTSHGWQSGLTREENEG